MEVIIVQPNAVSFGILENVYVLLWLSVPIALLGDGRTTVLIGVATRKLLYLGG